MPIYDYACTTCHKSFEHLARKMDEPAPACPECGGKAEKALSTFAVGAGAATGSSRTSSLPMGGGCCPCGKNAGACSRG